MEMNLHLLSFLDIEIPQVAEMQAADDLATQSKGASASMVVTWALIQYKDVIFTV